MVFGFRVTLDELSCKASNPYDPASLQTLSPFSKHHETQFTGEILIYGFGFSSYRLIAYCLQLTHLGF